MKKRKEKNMKKFIAIVLCLVMVLSIVACGKKTETPAAEAPKAEEGAKKLQVVNLVNGNLGDKSSSIPPRAAWSR